MNAKRKKSEQTEDFKIEVVKRSFDGDLSISDVAESYGVSATALYTWRNKYKHMFQHVQAEESAVEVHEYNDSDEVKELQRELSEVRSFYAELKEHCEFLEKVIAYFVDRNPQSTQQNSSDFYRPASIINHRL